MISLHPYSVEKLKYIEKSGIQSILFNAVDGNNMNVMDRLNYISPFYSPVATYCSMGCAMSHIKVWESFLQTNMDYAFIMEDDVVFDECNLEEYIADAIKQAEDFDILMLGYFKSIIFNVVFYPLFGKSNICLGTHAYILSRTGAEKLLKELKGNVWCPIDFSIQWLVSRGKIKRTLVENRIIFQTSTDELKSSTNIQHISPVFLYRFLGKFHVDKYLRLSYLFYGSIIRIGDFNINIIYILIVIILLFILS